MADRDVDVDPERLNQTASGIHLMSASTYLTLICALKRARHLGWIVQWSADQWRVTLTPSNPCSVLRPGMTYTIDFVVQDGGCLTSEGSITFRTKADSSFDAACIIHTSIRRQQVIFLLPCSYHCRYSPLLCSKAL